MDPNRIIDSIKLYRNFSRLFYKFPEVLQPKIRYNLKEAFDINKYLLNNKEINHEDIDTLIRKSNNLYLKLSSMSEKTELFSELFRVNKIK
ncbi:hypothetical protein DICPUDRAFT_33997 [Dictyostelium purpureum]|uniref:Uncharacterized protein n=1 Tax=Dictyostelium purpureum TaxID=5786 RepID=F0ZLU8_DICPU|nr:uncharacterized protein DICPUDRAFT_33997 [Dictyostelium purpureum]EGC35077.1 hypothetical protein DICPUDRAFT_33997 [Dictyostelium purpureum]|eukprot:XP_003288384.1 hypothetical protein DICPUDRAFT_33997 [Dictyostelium purpureum]